MSKALAKSQMSKHISKKLNKPAKSANRPSTNTTKIGAATAKRMTQKNERKRPKDFDEEIDSDDLGEDIDQEEVQEKQKGKAIESDPFFAENAQIEKNETIEERRLRMTKKLLEELKTDIPMKDDFFENL